MSALRKAARDRECQIRLVGICSGDRATVVLAHYRLAGISGMGMKSPDAFGAWACFACHAYCDTHHDDATKRAHLEGVLRTQYALMREGKL